MKRKEPKEVRVERDINIAEGDVVGGDKTVIYNDAPQTAKDQLDENYLKGSVEDAKAGLNVHKGDVVFGDKINQFIQKVRNIYIFKDIPQLAFFLTVVILMLTGIGGGYWYSQQPRIMTGDFNIAVAEFSQAGNSEPKVAAIVSQQVFRFLDDQAKLIAFENVEVSHKNIGVITNAEEARDLARRIHAQVVIYGDVSTFGEDARLAPQFYVAEAFRADVGELNGQQKLAAPISFAVQDLLNPTSIPMELVQERTIIMTEFTKALVYLRGYQLSQAQEAIRLAIAKSEQQDPFEGREVLYLFASEIARQQGDRESAQKYVDKTLALNPNYGRGYIAQANIYYDLENLFQANENYKKAKNLPDQPLGAYIPEKASLGIGNTCWLQLQYVKQSAEADPIATADLEQCALDNYEEVIAFYEMQKNPEKSLEELAAWAYYGKGVLLQARDRPREAYKYYKKSLRIATDDELIKRINAHVEEVEQ